MIKKSFLEVNAKQKISQEISQVMNPGSNPIHSYVIISTGTFAGEISEMMRIFAAVKM